MRFNQFDNFFLDETYLAYKNLLYNYQIRKKKIGVILAHEHPKLILEVGSGISPIITGSDIVVYSDLSVRAIHILKHHLGRGFFVVADARYLPFRKNVFSHLICSEVLEHLERDGDAIRELWRVAERIGRLFLTFPHRKFYFAIDDRFVNHFRRYELIEIENLLENTGFKILLINKVLGPLEKVTMWSIISYLSTIKRSETRKFPIKRNMKPASIFLFLFNIINRLYTIIALLDAWIMPMSLATVLLVVADKRKDLL